MKPPPSDDHEKRGLAPSGNACIDHPAGSFSAYSTNAGESSIGLRRHDLCKAARLLGYELQLTRIERGHPVEVPETELRRTVGSLPVDAHRA